MDRELVVVVPSETVAYEVVRTLKSLDDEGSIELYSSNVIKKSKSGIELIRDTRQVHAPLATALGLSAGALIGLLGGPAGVAIGAAIGGAAGMGTDLTYSGFAGDFVHDVSARLPEGAYAVVASVWEDWTVPVDVAMAPYGGVVFRQATDDVVIAQIRGDMQALDDEAAHLDAEIAKASDEAKAKLVAKKNELRTKQTAQREKMRARANKLEDQWHARIENIKAKNHAAKAEAKARHMEHMEKLSRFAALQKESFRELFS